MREMAESDSSGSSSSHSSVTDNETDFSSSNSYSSGMSDDEDGFSSLSYGMEVLPYRFEPEPSPVESHTPILTDAEDTPHSRVGNTNW